MIKLHTYKFEALNVDKPRGLIYIFHGMHSHTQTSSHIAHAYAQKGLLFYYNKFFKNINFSFIINLFKK